MTEQDYWHFRNSGEAHNRQFTHESEMNRLVQGEELNLVAMLKPKIGIDGNMWFVLYGDNLHDGVAGFGETPYKAILDFNKSFHQPLKAII